jgi:hypothetical protein
LEGQKSKVKGQRKKFFQTSKRCAEGGEEGVNLYRNAEDPLEAMQSFNAGGCASDGVQGLEQVFVGYARILCDGVKDANHPAAQEVDIVIEDGPQIETPPGIWGVEAVFEGVAAAELCAPPLLSNRVE